MASTVGLFTVDLDRRTLEGPEEYLKARGAALAERVMRGLDPVYNMTAILAPDPENALANRLQTDYAGWISEQEAGEWIAND